MGVRLTEEEREQHVQIVSLVSSLVHAWQVNDFHTAALRRDQLQGLGVKVVLPRRQSSKA